MQKFLDKVFLWLQKFLPEKIIKIVKPFLNVEFVAFIIIGVINTLSTTIFASVLNVVKNNFTKNNMYLHDIIEKTNLTFIIGYILSMIISFFLNTHFTFKERPTFKKFIKFPISYIPNFIIQYGIVGLLTMLGLCSQDWQKTLAYLFAAVIGIPITFITMKFFVYSKKK